ncbi:hypothetical protein K503DRAFT_783984 [Rhizopogon vinicolor AM-OR11-026]|uniref:Uncharacterized protein n=1 Tax=Rhizopogon vinicolor AM-OR11-026 TaxID=1314800 RepID=A0A1B7MWI1_9AGAM|nr:hypothetical protein K503DRAFT_783984 [Rhizopogon vinicolor AM-OR11-026]
MDISQPHPSSHTGPHTLYVVVENLGVTGIGLSQRVRNLGLIPKITSLLSSMNHPHHDTFLRFILHASSRFAFEVLLARIKLSVYGIHRSSTCTICITRTVHVEAFYCLAPRQLLLLPLTLELVNLDLHQIRLIYFPLHLVKTVLRPGHDGLEGPKEVDVQCPRVPSAGGVKAQPKRSLSLNRQALAMNRRAFHILQDSRWDQASLIEPHHGLYRF